MPHPIKYICQTHPPNRQSPPTPLLPRRKPLRAWKTALTIAGWCRQAAQVMPRVAHTPPSPATVPSVSRSRLRRQLPATAVPLRSASPMPRAALPATSGATVLQPIPPIRTVW